LRQPPRNPSHGVPGRVLDTGIEAQVHGPVDFATDVERLVADPAFRGTTTGRLLGELCRMNGIALDWHCGFRLAARDVPVEFRGVAVFDLAQRLADLGMIDAAVIGAAQRSLRLNAEDWSEFGAAAETLQLLKQLWHVVVHCGVAADEDCPNVDN
jgi:hypothetical protein